MNKYTDEELLKILRQAFYREITYYKWIVEFDKDYNKYDDSSFILIGPYDISKNSDGTYHLCNGVFYPGSYDEPADYDFIDISDEKDIWSVIKKILQCELENRMDCLGEIAESIEYGREEKGFYNDKSRNI